MTVEAWKFEGAISKTYNGHGMATLNEQKNVDADRYPIQLTEEKFEAVPLVQNVLGVLSNKTVSPLEQASVFAKDSEVIKAIGTAYFQAQQDYKKALFEACKKDKRTIERIEKLPTSGFFAFFARIGRVFTAHHRNILENGSVHRYAWMIATGTREEDRLANTEKTLRKRCEVLVLELQQEQEEEEDYPNVDKEKELQAIAALYAVMFPNTPLVVDETNVKEFVTTKLSIAQEDHEGLEIKEVPVSKEDPCIVIEEEELPSGEEGVNKAKEDPASTEDSGTVVEGESLPASGEQNTTAENSTKSSDSNSSSSEKNPPQGRRSGRCTIL